MAASTAEPPAFITSSAICVASGCEVAAIACGAYTALRVANGSPVMRSAANAPAAGNRVRRAHRNRNIGGNPEAGEAHTIAPESRPRVCPVLIRRGATANTGPSPAWNAGMSVLNPLSSAIDIARIIAQQARSQLQPQQPAPVQPPAVSEQFQGYQPEPAWHPQVAPQALQAGGPASCGPANSSYGPEGFSSYVHGQQARELDVDLMRMSHAAYGEEVDLCGWTEVTQDQLISEHGWDPDVRLDVPESQFSASVFTDGEGNYVLAYRGTADGAEDWITNFEQGAGLETTSGEFELLAPQVAQQFAQALGDGHPPGNLAITGHSQGGGLAAVGSLVTGIPAVTFDASGIHPSTYDRLGLDINASR